MSTKDLQTKVTEKENIAIEFMEKALQLTEKQFETFCDRMQDEFQNDKDYPTILKIICSLDRIRYMEKRPTEHYSEV
ncbi:MAG: hypothetical protein J1E05_08010 [Eubacterium sp.]|nr:hypothetical protein [Eubacterium sp.]